MKIALVTSVFPVPWDRTRGRPIYETARALSELADVEVFFTTAKYPSSAWLQPRGYIYGEFPPDYALPGVRMQAFDYPALPMVSRPLNGVVSALAMYPRLKAFKPDVVLAYWIYPEGYGALQVAQRLRVPCVVGSRGSDIRVRDRISSHFTGKTLRAVDEVITVSEELRGQAVSRYGAQAAQVTTIVNGCNTALFHPRERSALRRELGLRMDARWICYVGRLVQPKGLVELVQSLAALVSQGADVCLVLVGDGVFRAALETLVRELGLTDRVVMPGAVDPADVARWICASDTLCLPSHSEGYPNVVVEALACGVPVVATDVGGTREILDADSGELIAPHDVPGLTAALRRVLDKSWDAATLAGRYGRSWKDVAQQTLAICARALASSR